MFPGFVLEPKKRYNTTVTKPFHISMAALDPKSITDNEVSSLVLNVDGTETILCNLGKPNYLQERLDLNFIEGNTITLEVKGKATVHLSGYFIYEQDGMDEDDDSDLEDEEDDDLDDEDEETDPSTTAKALKALKKQMNKKNKAKFNASTTEDDSDSDDDEGDESMDVSDLTFDDDDDDDSDEDDDEEDEDDEEDDDEADDSDEEVKVASPGSTPMPPQKKAKQSANNTPVSNKKNKQQQQNEPGKKKGDKQQQSPQKPLTNGTTTPQSNKKKKNKDNAEAASPAAGTPNNKQGDGKTPRKSLEGGVIVEDIKVGSGVPAKSGKMISVYYVGKLKSNNKQFDSSTQGPGFKFRLGKGEVIKGWDVGLNGMKVGGKRRITIPAHMAYGNKGSPPAIPPNSTLVFDVELKNVN
ncbi:hypothetical protein M8J76_001382 [Diaphorina citri]|nr:hypothetical protein M8J75_007330 [Diaphorina citri]KAI5718860.1 hypothetical protein M8J76_001382 [Diaphorina citri]